MLQLLVVIGVILINKNSLKKEFQDFRQNGLKYLKDNFCYYAYGYIGMIVCNLIITTFILNGNIATNESANRELLTSAALYAIPSMLILAPIGEELAFKKSFDGVFKNKIVFVIITGVLFGGAHLLSATSLKELSYIFSYSSLGIAFSYMYQKTNNIFTNITYHIIHNTITVCLLLLTIL